MKKHLIISICLFTLCSLSAQTQSGIVKTKGRLNQDGSVTAGIPLSDVYVSVRGAQTVTSNKKGQFSVSLKTRDFYLKEVSKEGYALCDADALSRPYAYSKSPLYIVMETPSQQLNDKLMAERKLRNTLTQQLQQKEAELDSLKEKQQITDEAYRQALQKIYSNQEENEQLISEMSERYAKIDYDQLDEFNQRISNCILEGRLTEADSLIRAKGNMQTRVSAFFNLQERNKNEEQQIKQRLKKLEKSKAYEQQELEDLAQDCYSLFEIFKMQHQNDSAAYYLELRASLDTANVDWMLETGNFIVLYLANYEKAISILSEALSIAKQKESASLIVNCCNDLGFAYGQIEDIEKAMQCYNEALNLAKGIGDSVMESDIYLNMGDVYTDLGDYENAFTYYHNALERVDQKDKESKAIIMGNIGNLYNNMSKYEQAMRYTKDAISLIKEEQPETNSTLALLYASLASINCELENVSEAIDNCNKALQILLRIYGENHPNVANVYGTLGQAYSIAGEDEKALECKEKAVIIKSAIFGELSPKLSVSYNNLAKLYSKLGKSDLSIQLYQKALTIQQIHLGATHFSCAIINNNLGFEYRLKGDFTQALNHYMEALNIINEITRQGNRNPYIISILNNIGCLYQKMGDYRQSIDYLLQCLDNIKNIYDKYPPSFNRTVTSLDSSYRKAIEENPKDKNLSKEYAAFLKVYKQYIIDQQE